MSNSGTNIQQTILGLDPGRDKCGVAVMNNKQKVLYHQVIGSQNAIATIQNLAKEFAIDLIVMGDGTTSKIWQQQIDSIATMPVVSVNETNSTLEARDRYWIVYPPKGLQRMIPLGLRVPPRPVDDIVAILLIERYLDLNKKN